MLGGRALASLLIVATTIVVTSVVGCKRDLGDCNLDGLTQDGRPLEGPAAFDIAYRFIDGLPMYEGQALVQSTCGNGQFCHSPAAKGADRIGVPAELDFDVSLACTSADPTCAQPIESCEGGQTDTPYCERLRRFHGNQSNIRDWAEGMMQEIRAGAMPPGEAGRRVRDASLWIRQSDGSELPSIESTEGQEIVRNWLACQAPAIARAETPASPAQELEPCPSVDDEICVFNGPLGELPDPAWSEIYWSLIFVQCVTCHGPLNGNTDQNPDRLGEGIPGGASQSALDALDLTGSNTMDTTDWPTESWSAVVDALAADPGDCAGQGTLVIPNDSAGSIMTQKLRGTQTCGDVMPPTQGGEPTVPEPLIEVVEDWIDMGAPNN